MSENVEIKSFDLHNTLINLKAELHGHMKIEKAMSRNQFELLKETRRDIKEYRTHVDETIKNIQENIDQRIDRYNNDMKSLLESQYYNKGEINNLLSQSMLSHIEGRRSEITAAILASKNRIWAKVRLVFYVVVAYSGVITFIHNYGHIVLEIIEAGD